MAELLKPPYLQVGEKRGDHQVWIVDGAYVRGHIDEEFTNFGQHYRYPYIPEKEFWIDKEAEHDERAFFIEHLLAEHDLMAKGASYVDALTQADRVERKERRRAGDVRKGNASKARATRCRCRHHPDELHDALTTEGWA